MFVRREYVVLSKRCLIVVILFIVSSATPCFASTDKLYDYLVRLGTVINFCDRREFKQAIPGLDSLLADLEKDSTKDQLKSPAGLHLVTPIVRCPEKCGDLKRRLYIEVLDLRGQCRSNVGNTPGAISDLTKAIQLCPDNPFARLSLADAYARQGATDKALIEVNKGIKLAPASHEALFVRAGIYERMGRTAEKDRDLSEANRLGAAENQKQRELDMKFADAPNKPSTQRMTVEVAKPLIRQNPRNAYWVANYARTLMDLSRFRDAIKYATIAVAMNDEEVFGYMTRAGCERAIGNYDMALKDANQSLKLQPGNFDIILDRGITNIEMGKIQDAIKDYNEVVKRAPNWTDGYTFRCAAYIQARDLKKALSDAKRAIALDPEFDLAYNNLGAVLTNMNDYAGASKAYQTAIRLQKSQHGYAQPMVLFGLGKCYWKLGRKTDAYKEWDKAMLVSPHFPHYLLGRAASAAQCGHRDIEIKEALKTGRIVHEPFVEQERIIDALSLFERLNIIAPRRMETLYFSAVSLVCLNEKEKAISQLRQITPGSSPWFDRAAVLLFLCTERNGNDAKAKTELRANLSRMRDRGLRALSRFFLGEIDENKMLNEIHISSGTTRDIKSGGASPGRSGVGFGIRGNVMEQIDTSGSGKYDITRVPSTPFLEADETAARVYMAHYFVSKGDLARAKANLEWALSKGNKLSYEGLIALSELDRLCGVKSKLPGK